MIELITLHRDGRLTVRIKDPDGAVDEYEFTRKGLVRVNAIFADGRILRADAAVLDAAFGSDRAELDDRVRQLFLDRSKFTLKLTSPDNPKRHLFGNKRMALEEQEFLEKALLID